MADREANEEPQHLTPRLPPGYNQEMDRKPLTPIEENAWTINLLIVAAIIGLGLTIWLGPWGFPGMVIPMALALPMGQAIDQARKRRRDSKSPPEAP